MTTPRKKTVVKKRTPRVRNKPVIKPAVLRTEPPRTVVYARTTKPYVKIVVAFSVVTLLLLGLIGYFAFARTTLTVIRAVVGQEIQERIDFVPTDTDVPVDKEVTTLAGSFITTTISDTLTTREIAVSGQVDDTARGTVTIYNRWNQDQPLQATTRLLTPEGILFRIAERVDVPAGGKVDNVAVYADVQGASGNIMPTRFTLPGLWEGLRDDIYAESFAPMTGGTKDARIVTANDITSLNDELSRQMEEQAINDLTDEAEKLGVPFSSSPEAIVERVVLEETLSADVGESADELTLTMRIRFIALSYDHDALITLAEHAFAASLDDDLEPLPLDDQAVTLTAEKLATSDGTAVLRLRVSGEAHIRDTSPIFDREKLTGKSARDIELYFDAYPEVGHVSVHFSPFWLKRTPSIKDHITLEFLQ